MISKEQSSEQQLVNKWRNLTPAQKQKLLRFIEHLELENSDKLFEGEGLPTIEIWSPFDSYATAQDLDKLFEEEPGALLD